MAVANAKLNSAIKMYKSKDVTGAKKLLMEIAREDAKNETAWLYLSACISNVDQKKKCLSKVIAINPNNQQALKMMAKISSAKASPSLPAVKPSNEIRRKESVEILSEESPPRSTLKACLYCGEMIQSVAIVCRFCGRDISSPVAPLNPMPAVPDQINPQPIEMKNAGLKCVKYPEREAAGICTYSGKPYCLEELVEVSGKLYARDHLDKVFSEAKENAAKQQTVAPSIVVNANSNATNTVNMGGEIERGTKSRTTSIVLCLCWFLGFGGLHRLYTGNWIIGIIQFLTWGMLGIWQLIDLLTILGGSYRDARGEVLIR